jgi:2-phospho-L-lactate guanylyltransferase
VGWAGPYTHGVPRPDTAAVLIPVKSFARAKVRLAGVLDDEQRSSLARGMAERVVAAADPLPVWCVCDDEDVRDWAASVGAQVEWTPGLGLNGAVQTATARRGAAGVARVVVAHGDLPFAAGLADLAVAGDHEALLVPDRRGRGSNVVSVPTGAGFRFAYGEGSLERHLAEAARCGLSVRVVRAEHLGWDVDEPDDLDVPDHLGRLPGATP